jgi:site-specific recombinase XerD
MAGQRYTIESLNVLWKKACTVVGEDIDMYSGLKHSSCSQYLNEKGFSLEEVKELTDHARIESVKRYAKVTMTRKKSLMERGKKLKLVVNSSSRLKIGSSSD